MFIVISYIVVEIRDARGVGEIRGRERGKKRGRAINGRGDGSYK